MRKPIRKLSCIKWYDCQNFFLEYFFQSQVVDTKQGIAVS